jgi:hypothetical protein
LHVALAVDVVGQQVVDGSFVEKWGCSLVQNWALAFSAPIERQLAGAVPRGEWIPAVDGDIHGYFGFEGTQTLRGQKALHRVVSDQLEWISVEPELHMPEREVGHELYRADVLRRARPARRSALRVNTVGPSTVIQPLRLKSDFDLLAVFPGYPSELGDLGLGEVVHDPDSTGFRRAGSSR